tara:strand:+ start:398 stop:1081 length:684 start_codon:yes stop_codon:yes gene_type:complete
MKIKYGSLVVDGSGKIGGHVASKGRAGSVLRTKVTGINPQSSAQNKSRALLGSLSTGWSNLTEGQRDSWNGAVKDYATTDIFGDIKTPSGFNLYVKLNANLIASGQTAIDIAPEKVEQNYNSIVDFTMYRDYPESSGFTMLTEDAGGRIYMVRTSPPVSAGVSNGKSKLAVLGYYFTETNSIITGYEYEAKYGRPPAGTKIFGSVTEIYPNGQKGVEMFTSSISLGD